MLKSLRTNMGFGLLALGIAMPASAGFYKTEHIVQCMKQNLVERGALRELTATTKQLSGDVQALTVQVRWQPDQIGHMQMNLQVTEPQDIAGTAYLIKPSDAEIKAWLYIPALESVRKVSAQSLTQSLWGTEFSYAQLRQVLGLMMNGQSERLADEVLADREVYVVDTRTDGGESQFLAVRSYIDKQSCLLLRSEYLGRSGELLQILEAETANMIQTEIESRNVWMLLQYQMTNLQTGQKTILEVGGIHLMEETAADAFHKDGFYKAVKVLH